MSQKVSDTQQDPQLINDYQYPNYHHDNQRNQHHNLQESFIKNQGYAQNRNNGEEQNRSKIENLHNFDKYKQYVLQSKQNLENYDYKMLDIQLLENQKEIKDNKHSDKRQYQINFQNQNLSNYYQNSLIPFSEFQDDLQFKQLENHKYFQHPLYNEQPNTHKNNFQNYPSYLLRQQHYENLTPYTQQPPQKFILPNSSDSKQQTFHEQEIKYTHPTNNTSNSYNSTEVIQQQLQKPNFPSSLQTPFSSSIESSYGQQQVSDSSKFSINFITQISEDIFKQMNSFNFYQLNMEYDEIRRQLYFQQVKKQHYEAFIEDQLNKIQNIQYQPQFYSLLIQDLFPMREQVSKCNQKINKLSFQQMSIQEGIQHFKVRSSQMYGDINPHQKFINTFEKKSTLNEAINIQKTPILCNDVKLEFEQQPLIKQPIQQTEQQQIPSSQQISIPQQIGEQKVVSQSQMPQQHPQQLQTQEQTLSEENNEIDKVNTENQLKPKSKLIQQNTNSEIEDEEGKEKVQIQGNKQIQSTICDQIPVNTDIVIKKESDIQQDFESNIENSVLIKNSEYNNYQQQKHCGRDYYSLITRQHNLQELDDQSILIQAQLTNHLQQIPLFKQEISDSNIQYNPIKQEYTQLKQIHSYEQNRDIFQMKNEEQEQFINYKLNEQNQNQMESIEKSDACLEKMKEDGFYLSQKNENGSIEPFSIIPFQSMVDRDRLVQFQNQQVETIKRKNLKALKKIKKEKPHTDLEDPIRFRNNEIQRVHLSELQLSKKKQFHNQFKIFMLQCTKYIIKHICSHPDIHNNQQDRIEYHKRYLLAFKNRFTKSDLCYFMKEIKEISLAEIEDILKIENIKTQQIQQRKIIFILIIIGSFLNKEEMDQIIARNHPDYQSFFDQGCMKLSEYLKENPDKINKINDYIHIICEFNTINRMVIQKFCQYEIGVIACKKKASKLDQFYCKNYIMNMLLDPSMIE